MCSPSIRPFLKQGASTTCGQIIDCGAFMPTKLAALVGNVTLRDILAFEHISKSKAYGLGLVPLYDKSGLPIENNTSPPFPWLRLPPPIVKMGKKLWNAEDVMTWHHCVRARALSTDNSMSSNDPMQREALHDY